MFGIGGSELIFILLIVLMLFGSDKIPEMARTLGKTMAQIKNATNDIKQEISKGAKETGLDMNSITDGISSEIKKAKDDINQSVNPLNSISEEIQNPIQQAKEDIENLTGPIKRQH